MVLAAFSREQVPLPSRTPLFRRTVTPHQTPGPSVRPNATYPTFHAYAASNSVWSHFQVFGNNSQYCDGRVIRIRGSTADNQASGSTLC